MFVQLLQIVADIAVYLAAFQLVGFGENDGKRHSVLAQPFYKGKVDGLRLMAAVDEDKEAGHLLALQDIGLYDALNLLLSFLSASGVAIAGKVDDIPVLVDQEMIDEHCFSGNKPPKTLQIVMRTDEISVDDDTAKTADAEVAKAKESPLRRMWNVLVQMWKAMVSIFKNR